jgi:drug/metabolite transporter (DMT)-like permease
MTPGAWGAFVALGIIWGIPYFLIKIALEEVEPLFIAWSRLTLAALVLLPLAWRRGALAQLRGHGGAVLAFALVEFVVPFAAISIGEQWIHSSVTGLLIAMVPLFVAGISRFAGVHEPMTLERLSGLLIGLGGVALLLGFGGVQGPLGWVGAGLMLLAALGYACGPLIMQRKLAGLDAYGPVTMSQLVAAAILLPGAIAGWPSHLPSARTLIAIGLLGVACSAIAMLLMFYLVRSAGPGRSSVITYVNPAVATLLGVLVLREPLGWSGYAAFALILLGSWLATRASAVPAHS